jgi:hypothetical protein
MGKVRPKRTVETDKFTNVDTSEQGGNILGPRELPRENIEMIDIGWLQQRPRSYVIWNPPVIAPVPFPSIWISTQLDPELNAFRKNRTWRRRLSRT